MRRALLVLFTANRTGFCLTDATVRVRWKEVAMTRIPALSVERRGARCCVWIETGTARQPLACIWVEREMRMALGDTRHMEEARPCCA